jgi:hypothetical protein
MNVFVRRQLVNDIKQGLMGCEPVFARDLSLPPGHILANILVSMVDNDAVFIAGHVSHFFGYCPLYPDRGYHADHSDHTGVMDWDNLVKATIKDRHSGFGSAECHAIRIFSSILVYDVVEYDGSTSWDSFSLLPFTVVNKE